MKNKSYIMALLLVPVGSSAQVRPVVGVGFAHATARHDGTWYQRAFPHSLKLNHPEVSLGLRWDINQHWTTTGKAIWFGHYSSDAYAVPADSNYDPATRSCVGPCLPRAHYMGRGWIGALALTAGWHTSGPWQWGVRAGPIYYRQAWRLRVPDWYLPVLQPDGSYVVKYRVPVSTSDLRWAFGYTAGTYIRHGQWSVSLDWYRDGGGFPGHAGAWPPIWRWHTTLGIGRSF